MKIERLVAPRGGGRADCWQTSMIAVCRCGGGGCGGGGGGAGGSVVVQAAQARL